MSDRFTRPSQPERRVVVTGLSVISPVGLTVDENWSNLMKGQSGISTITQFDAANYDTKIAGEVKGFVEDNFVPKKEQKKMDRFIHLSLATSKLALEDSGVQIKEEDQPRFGTIIGVGMGGLPAIEKQHQILLEKGPSRLSPFFIPAVITNLAAGHVSMALGAKGPNFCVTSACASGAHAIGEAAQYIRRGLADVMIAGGSEAVVCPMAIGGFAAMRALSTRNDQPTKASRPWDRDRDGFVLAEGSASLILEDLEHAERRGAKIYAEICGYGSSSDAYHMTSPSPGGAGAALAMANAIENARINRDEIDYINAHGTSTPVGDEIETQAVKRVFGDHAKNIWVSSTKSMTGHTLGAAGAIETIYTILALHRGQVPPTINLENPSPDCDLDYVPLQGREKKLRYAISNSFGFGGTNSSLVLGQWNDQRMPLR